MKEPHFFSRHDLREVPAANLPSIVQHDYVDRFFPNAPAGRLLAEASVSYLYAPERLLPALSIWPDAKFIIAVRNPLKMLPSLHLRNLHNGDETVRDFRAAYGRQVGVKPAGGIRTTKDAIKYLVLINETVGDDWLSPDWFRFGASSLVNDLLMQRTKLTTGHYAGPDYFTLD